MCLFIGALGVRIKATSEERENERRVLREAKGVCLFFSILAILIFQWLIVVVILTTLKILNFSVSQNFKKFKQLKFKFLKTVKIQKIKIR